LLLLFGALFLESVGMALAAVVLLIVGLIFTPAEKRFRGAMAAGTGLAVALGLVVALRLLN
jgi:hypothetical protein